MPWPIASDYQEAIQNPQLCFADADLKLGKAKENLLGPIPITGAFASVYQVTTPTGRWAVRCFLTQVGDHQRRYAAISAHLQSSRLKYAVRFEYLEQGIRVKGQWYPILKMEWIDGDPLNSFVANNLNQPSRLLQLTREWVEMMNGLKAAQIAHGDLQHGNILVTPAGLRLIDYDGMYVPALAGLTSHEEGHRNYQHPNRTGDDFGLYVDNFSAWVVFCSIMAVAKDSRLWQMLDGGDECLLFRRDDFRHPDRSRVFQVLQRSRPEVRAVADHFRSLVRLSIKNVPSLDGRIVPQERTTLQPTPAAPIPEWLSDHVRSEPTRAPEPTVTAATDSNAGSFAGADWIIQHLVDQQTPAVALRKHSFVIERITASVWIIIVVSLSIASIQGVITTFIGAAAVSGVSGIVVMLFIIRYGHATHSKERRKTSDKLRSANSVMKMLSVQMKDVATKRKEVVTPLTKLEAEFREWEQKMNQELADVQQRVQSFRLAFDQERQKLASDENQAMRTAEQDARRQSGSLQVELNSLVQAERSELAQAIANHRNAHIKSRLENAPVRNASLYRIGARLKDRLEAYGIHTAADVEYNRVIRVEGFGPAFTSVLMEWRREIEYRATQSAPSFSDSTANAIRYRFATRKRELELQISSINQREQRMRDAVLERFQQARAAYDEQERQNLATFDNDGRLIQAKYKRELQRIDGEYRTQKAKLGGVLREHDNRLSELNRKKTQQRFEVCKLEREIDQLRRLSWGRYLTRTLGLGRAA